MTFTRERKGASVAGDSSRPFEPNWENILGLIPLWILAFTTWPIYLAMGGGIQWQEIAVFFFMYLLSVIGICVGYHRAISHRSLKMKPLLKFITLFSGASTGEGCAVTWVSDHRRHHRYEDTPQDPYNVKRGFWWAHIGWVFGQRPTTDFSNVQDLLADKMMRHQHKYYVLWFVVSSLLLPFAIGWLIGRPWACLFFAGFVRLFLVQQATFLINSYAHYFGRRPYSNKITAKDSLLCAILASGEGWHNFHHRFPFDYRNGHRFYHWDPAKWLINLFRCFGLAYDLKTTPQAEIYRAKMMTQKDRLEVFDKADSIEHLTESVEAALQKWRQLNLQMNQLREQKTENWHQKMNALQAKVKLAQKEFQESYASWKLSAQRKIREAAQIQSTAMS